jgi:hypothetical protein
MRDYLPTAQGGVGERRLVEKAAPDRPGLQGYGQCCAGAPCIRPANDSLKGDLWAMGRAELSRARSIITRRVTVNDGPIKKDYISDIKYGVIGRQPTGIVGHLP